jgi:protein-S-isoprenylcysteine O-methyltransferase Ste14
VLSPNGMYDTPAKPPRSLSHWLDPFIILAVAILVYWSLRSSAINNLIFAIVIVLSITVVMATIEFLRAPWSPFKSPTVSVRPPRRALTDIVAETSLQWLGMIAFFAFILFIWWLLAEYSRSYYAPFFNALPLLMLVGPMVTALALFAAEYFCGRTMRGGRELGLLIGRSAQGAYRAAFRNANWTIIRDELMSWLLFGFFLPLNFVELVKAIGIFRGQEAVIFGDDIVKAQYFLVVMIYGAIIASITPGYLFGSRLIRTETRGVDHSWFGWTVTLICYDPVVTAVFGRWFDYRAAIEGPLWMRPWATTLEHVPTLLIVVGAAIIVCELFHLWGEAQFGLRSSNLSNRGVITTGPYRITKHPVYVSKLAGWLLIWMPFIAGGSVVTNLRMTLLWGGVCIIYILRALAEEKVLAKDPDYVAYALYMDKHGMFAWVGKYLPFMTFRYRLEKWRAAEQKPIEIPASAPVVVQA